jgi:predicted nucleic acid-binding protein
VDAGRLPAVTSSLTLLETLVVPYGANDSALTRRSEALLRNSRGLTLVDIDADLLRAAARLRARLRIRTPDALQLAGCTCFVTHGRDLPELPQRVQYRAPYVLGESRA